MKRSTLLLIVILLFAAALRVYRIDAQSLWSDEGASVVQAMRDVPSIVANAAADIHPPLYYILLHFWVMPFGTSEIGVRSFSALLGVVLVLMCYLLGKQLWDERTGVLATALAAINPLQIYYSQEARMYMLMALLGALCVYATLRTQTADGGRRTAWIALYVGAAIAGLYTHYLFPIVIVVCNLVFVLSWFRSTRAPSDFWTWTLSQFAVLIAFVPWLPTAIQQLTTWPSGAQTFGAGAAPLIVLRTMSEGLSAPADDALWLTLFAALLLIGSLPISTVHRPPSTAHRLSSLIALLFLLAPIAVMFALALFKDAFLKFLLVASPPFVLLVAHGIVNLSDYALRITHPVSRILPLAARILVPALLVVIALPSALALQNYFFNSRFARDDYRGIAQTISALAREGDAIVLDAPGQQEIFDYYYHGSAPIYPLPRQRPMDASATLRELDSIAGQHARVFAVFWSEDESDPSRVVESWLNAHSFKANDTWFGNVRLAMYANATTNSLVSVGVGWNDGIHLAGYALAGQSVTAGDVWPVTLMWRNEQPISKRYKVFVHLLDPRGFVIAQRDAEPVGGSRPTTTWQVGESILDSYGLFVPFGTPPHAYQIEIGLYDLDTGQRLRNERGEDHLLLDAVQVRQPPRTPPLAVYDMQRVDTPMQNGLQLLGYRLDKLGVEGQSATTFHVGDVIHVSLYWRKQGAASDGVYRLTLGALTRDAAPTAGLYAVAQWSADEIVRDDQLVQIPNDWQAGSYALAVNGQTLGRLAISN